MKGQLPLLAIILTLACGTTSLSVLAASHGGSEMHGDSMDGMQGGGMETQERKEQQMMEGDSDEGDRDRDRERDEDDSDMEREMDRDRDQMQDDS